MQLRSRDKQAGLEQKMGKPKKIKGSANEDEFSCNEHLHFDEVIRRKIHHTFVNFIIPGNVLHIFWKYDPRILAKKDAELVEAETTNKGPTAGAEKLLELLCKYENWVPVLIQVLRDDSVNQRHVAEMILKAIEEVQSDKNVSALAKREVLIERLRTNSEQLRNRLTSTEKILEQKVQAEKIKDLQIQKLEAELNEMKDRLAVTEEMLEQKVLAESNKHFQIQELEAELHEVNKNLEKERERYTAKEKEMSKQKVRAQNEKVDQEELIQELTIENEKILKEKVLAQQAKKEQDRKMLELTTKYEILVQGLLGDTTDMSMKETLMLRFSECGDHSAMKQLIKRGVDINKANRYGQTALMFAASTGNLESTKWLLNESADINKMDRNNWTALSYAAFQGDSDCVELLLQAGSHTYVSVKDINGLSPLMLAADSKGDNVQCVQKLLNAAADKDMENESDEALVYATRSGNFKCEQALHDAITAVNSRGSSSTHC